MGLSGGDYNTLLDRRLRLKQKHAKLLCCSMALDDDPFAQCKPFLDELFWQLVNIVSISSDPPLHSRSLASILCEFFLSLKT